MLILRPGRAADLPALEEIARGSAAGLNPLARNSATLRERILDSGHSLAAEVAANGEETYFFVLEDPATGAIVGTSGISASAGYHDRFYSYRNEVIVHASRELGVSNRIHSLHLCHDLTGASLLTSFFIDPALAASAWPQLLSRGRLLFIAQHPRRFDARLAAEMPGVSDDTGRSPFWDAVGRRFFDMEYPQADLLSGGHSKTFIAELMPQYPIYVPLLPERARLAIGQMHPVAQLPFSILREEGFETGTYVDIFDGGPTVEARVAALRTIRTNRRARVERSDTPVVGTPHLIANTATQAFRATIAALAPGTGEAVRLDARVADLLGVGEGDPVRVVALEG